MDPKFFSAYDSKIQPSVLMVVPAAERHPAVSESFTQENCIFRFPEDKDITTIHPRNLEPYVDLGTVKNLIEFCEQHHGPGCPKRHDTQNDIIDLPGFRVIDCNDASIVGSSLRQPFVALSYVWGRRRYQASPDWPQVVTDAVEVTKALGFRYLWVDRYCIDQDNAEEKHNQITNMDSIYESAQLTIMAAAGENAEYGLPGVGRGRVVSESLKLDGVSVGSVPPDISRSVQSSVWWSRGWTYQEGVLSRRRLIFTDDQVYFQCNNMISYETFDIPLEEFHMASLTRQRDLIQPCIFTGDRADRPSTKTSNRKVRQDRLLYHIRNYSHRTLSFTSDGLNAFQGIISAIQLRTFYGLIVSSKFPRSEDILSKVNTCQSRKDGSIANFGDGMELAVALVSWWHETEMPLRQQRRKKDDKLLPIRLPDFPSWSWLGWRGVVHNTSSLAKIQNATTNYFEADIAGPELSLSLLSPRVFALFYIHKEDLAALLEPVVTLYHGRRINSAMIGGGSPLPKVPRNTKLTNWQWTMRGGPEPVVLRFKLSVAFNQRDLANKLFMGDIQVILMAQTDTDYVFLVVHGPGYTVYRRIGICLAQKGPAKKWISRDRDSGSLGWAFLTPLLASIELH